MKTYLVGGAIRDKLLGIEPEERDWVVVGSSQKELLELGYKQVGKQFPVFLHPDTSEEHALARVEKKVGSGHKGFEFVANEKVSLEEDLLRRDLTINAIAQDEKGELIDPFGGLADIENKVIRHVSEAFSEDPLRVLRVARFYTKLKKYGFNIHDSTIEIMKKIVSNDEIETLSKERLWNEISKAFNENNPWMFFEVLIKTNFAKRYCPEIIDNENIKEKILYFSKIDLEKKEQFSDFFPEIAKNKELVKTIVKEEESSLESTKQGLNTDINNIQTQIDTKASITYVDNVAQGLSVKNSCRCATTENISLSGTQTIDGITINVNDRILVKNQDDPKQNGIYNCKTNSWSRSDDMNESTEFTSSFTFINFCVTSLTLMPIVEKPESFFSNVTDLSFLFDASKTPSMYQSI